MRYLLYCTSFFCLHTFSSCLVTYGDTISRQYTLLKPDTTNLVPMNKPIPVYFDGEPINFPYVKIGLVEVKGDQFSNTSDLINHLKYEAFKNGGDAVIAVKDGYTTRQSGLLFSKTPPAEYSSHVYTGIAVKLDEQHKTQPGSTGDIEYITRVQAYDAKCAKSNNNRFTASIVLTFVLIGAVIYVVATK